MPSKPRTPKNKLVTFHRAVGPSEFIERWRIDIGDGVLDTADSLSDLSGWLFDRDFPRRMFTRESFPGYAPVSDLELALLGELGGAIMIRKWHRRASK